MENPLPQALPCACPGMHVSTSTHQIDLNVILKPFKEAIDCLLHAYKSSVPFIYIYSFDYHNPNYAGGEMRIVLTWGNCHG